MKVKSIDTYQAKDGSDRWRINFEENEHPLIVATKPITKEGDDIPIDKLKFIQKENYAYYVWKQERQTKSYGRSKEETAAIRGQVAIKALTDIFIAGKIEELITSNNYLIVNLKEWIQAALIHDPMMVGILKGGNQS